MNKKVIVAIAYAWLALGSYPINPVKDYNPDAWMEDFRQLKQELASHYSNLDWAITHRKLDLKQLSDHTQARLKNASSDVEAKKILEAFLDAFGDGHLFVQWPKEATGTAPGEQQLVAASTLCERLQFSPQTQASKIDLTLLEQYREIKNEDSKYFTIGVLPLSSSQRVGILRIPLFSEYAFPDLCVMATVEMQLSKEAACDEECEDKVLRKAANLLTAALARQVNVLKQSKMDALLIDITGNGGGTNWMEPAARTLTAKALRSPRQQFIRHPHWTKQFETRLASLKAAKGNPTTNQQAETLLKKALMESKKTCDRSVLWENGKPDCSLVEQQLLLYPQSVLSYAKPGSLPQLPASRYLFYPSCYAYQEGVYDGKLFILVDRNTWSSAEYFAAMLRDNEAALLLGEPTGGAGCGYTNGGIPTILKNSGAKVKIPDCVRLRADGTNEVGGITPDQLIPWRANDNRYQRTKRVEDALRHLLAIPK